jgi:hypothetical protein
MQARVLTFCIVALAAFPAAAADWLFAPSDYTHSPENGQRVGQYCPPPRIFVYENPLYTKSLYRHNRSSLQVADSIDNLHVVEQTWPPVRPYREWQFPFRPYSAPYDAWGPQLPPFALGGGFGWGGFGGFGPGGPGHGGPGFGGPGFGGPGFGQPWNYGFNYSPFAPGAGPWGGTYTLPQGPFDPRSGVFGPSDQQEWFDRRSHGPQIRPYDVKPTNPPYPTPHQFPHFPGPKPDALSPGPYGPT